MSRPNKVCIQSSASRTLKFGAWQARTTIRVPIHHHLRPTERGTSPCLHLHTTSSQQLHHAANQPNSDPWSICISNEEKCKAWRGPRSTMGDRWPQPTKGSRRTEGQTGRRQLRTTVSAPGRIQHDQTRRSGRGTAATYATLRRRSRLPDIV